MSPGKLQTHSAVVGGTVLALSLSKSVLIAAADQGEATTGLAEEYCVVIPAWLSAHGSQLRALLGRCGLSTAHLITEPEACLAYYLSGRNHALIGKDDILLSCQMEEEMAVR